MPDIGDRGMEAANHLGMYVPMQQSCMICTCTPEPKVQFKKKQKQNINLRKGKVKIEKLPIGYYAHYLGKKIIGTLNYIHTVYPCDKPAHVPPNLK